MIVLTKQNGTVYIVFSHGEINIIPVHKKDFKIKENLPFFRPKKLKKTWINYLFDPFLNDILRTMEFNEEDLNFNGICSKVIPSINNLLKEYQTEEQNKKDLGNIFIIHDNTIYLIYKAMKVTIINHSINMDKEATIITQILDDELYSNLPIKEKVKIAFKRYFEFHQYYGQVVYILNTENGRIQVVNIKNTTHTKK